MPSQAFEIQNAKGQDAERRVAHILVDAGWGVKWLSRGNKHDLSVEPPSGTERVEVKNEDAFAHSGNLCIELFQGPARKPSGLAVSEASVCIHTLGETCAIFRKQPMLNHVMEAQRRNPPLYQVIQFGRADNANQGLKVPRIVLSLRDWYEEVPLEQLAASRVWAWRAA